MLRGALASQRANCPIGRTYIHTLHKDGQKDRLTMQSIVLASLLKNFDMYYLDLVTAFWKQSTFWHSPTLFFSLWYVGNLDYRCFFVAQDLASF